MTYVVDASAAYTLLVESRWDDQLRNAEELIAPDLIVPELLNARWKVARSGAAAPSLDMVLKLLAHLRILPSLPYARDAALLAEELTHSVHDCFYAVIAKREQAVLLTADLRFARKLSESAYGDILPE